MLKENLFLKMHPPIYMGEPFRGHATLPNPFWYESDHTKPIGEMANLTAVIFCNFDNQYVIGAYMDDGLGIFAPCGRYNDVIAMWRVTEIMPYCASINQHIYSHLLSAVVRGGSSKEKLRILSALIPGDYESIYRSVMTKKVPKLIIQWILDSQDSEFSISLGVITEEVRAGTVIWGEWEEAFAQAKVMRPSEVDEIVKRRREIVARYQKHIDDYTKFIGIDPNSSEVRVIADQVIYLVEQGIEKEHSSTVTFALAAAGLLSVAASSVIVATGDYDGAELENEVKNSLVIDASTWLAKHEKKWWKFGLSANDIRVAVAKLESVGSKYYLYERDPD